jgi:hypothetical protein
VLAEERQELRLKANFSMMPLLPFDIRSRFVQEGHAHGERALFHLPLKKPVFGKGVMHSFGRTSFDQLHRFRNRHG